MYEVVIVLFLLVAVAMIALILVQQGKGAGMGASFGAGASNTVFGSVGSGNFLTRSTWLCVVLFFGICLFISWMQKNQHQVTDSFSNIEAAEVQESGAATTVETPVVEDVPVVSDVPAVNDDTETNK